MNLFLDDERKAILQGHVDAGDRIAYWSQLSEWGYRYADFALAVVNSDTISGATANHFFLDQAAIEGAGNFSNDMLAEISLSLIELDFDARLLSDGQELSVNIIQEYHRVAFNNVGVSINAWTPAYALNSLETQAEREALWDAIISSDNPFVQGFSMMGSLFFNTILPGGDPIQEAQTAVWIAQVTAAVAKASVTSSNDFGPYEVDIGNGGKAIGGNSDDDTLSGTFGDDVLMGFDGNDRLDGGAGNDRLHDGAGSDVLIGGEGNDIYTLVDDGESDLIIIGESGYDLVRGGSPIDRIAILVDDLPPPPGVGDFLSPSGSDHFVLGEDVYSIGTLPAHISSQLIRIGSGSAPDMAVPILGDFRFALGHPHFGPSNREKSDLIFDELSYEFGSSSYITKPLSYSFEFYNLAQMQAGVNLFSGVSNYFGKEPDHSTVLAEYEELGLIASETTLFIRLIADEAESVARDNFESWVVIEDFYSSVGDNGIGKFGIDVSSPELNGRFPELTHIFNGGQYIDINATPDFVTPNGRGGEDFRGDSSDNDETGTALGDTFSGLGGNDSFDGGEGDDLAHGGQGDDMLDGGEGQDVLRGGNGADLLLGGPGNDRLNGGAGEDTLIGGEGKDRASYRQSDAAVLINLASGVASGGHADGDTLSEIENLSGSRFGDSLIGDGNSNRLAGHDGNDVLEGGDGNDILVGGPGADVLDGGNGQDWVIYNFDEDDFAVAYGDIADDERPVGVTVDLEDGTASGFTADGDVLISIENVKGTDFDDVIIGDDGDNRLVGRGGDDQLFGGDGDDRLIGGSGDNLLDGGDGSDWAIYSGAEEGITVDLGAIGDGSNPEQETVSDGENDETEEGDTLVSIENIVGSDFADEITGNEEDNQLRGRGGDDVLVGGDGNDDLRGGDGNDLLEGGEGNDWIVGGFGDDVLSGGSGGDTFIFREGFGSDIITDFDVESGDRINLRSLDIDDFGALQPFMSDGDEGVSIALGADTIVLAGVEIADLQADDFIM